MAEAGKVSISNPVELSALSSDLEKLRELLSDKNRDDAKTKQWAKEAASSLSDRLSLEAQSSSLLADSSDDRRQYIDSLQQASYIIANFLKAAQYFDDEEAEAIEQDIIVPSDVSIRSSVDGEEQGLVQETIRHPLDSDSSSSETGHSSTSSSSSSSSHSSEGSPQPLQKPVGVVTRCRLLNNPYPRDEIELKVFSIKVTGIDAGFNLEKVSPHTKVQDFIARLTVVRQNEKVKQSNKRLVLTIPQHSSGSSSSSSSSSSSVAAQMALSGSGGNNSIVMKPELSIWHYDLRHNDPVFLSYEDDFAQQTIWLKIVFFGQNPSSRPNLRRPFPDTSYRPPSTTIYVPKSCTVRDVLTRAIAEFKNHEIDPYYTGLFLFDDFLSGLWMDESLPISYYQVKDMDVIELKVLPQFQFLKHQPNNLLGPTGSPSQPNRRTSQTQTPLAPQPSEVFRCLKEVRLTDLRKSLSCWTDELIENPLELKIILRKHPSSVSPSVPATSVLQDSSMSLSGGEKTIGDFGIRTGDQLECFIKSKEQPILRFTTIADPSTEEVRQLHALPSHFLPSSFDLLAGEIVVEETPFVRMRSLVERDGFLVITNFRSIFVQRLAGRPADVVEWVSHGSIARIDSRDDASKTQEKSLEIFCKNIRFFRLTFYDGRALASSPLSSSTPSSSSSGASASSPASGPTVDQVRDRVMYQLTVRAFPNQLYGMFCFSYRPQHERKPEGGWDIYNCHREFTRMMISPKLWRVTEINRDFRYSPTYPRFLIVPEKISDQQLVGVFNFRARHRIPILTYYHSNSATITRSSQPLIGLVGNRSAEDEEMIKAIRLANQKNPNELFIMDARSRNAAVANKARGGGFETDYPNCPVEFLNIKNIHGVRDAYSKIEELCIYPESREFLTRLGSNDWIFMIKGLMMHSSRIAHLIHNTGTSVLLHCSDGWDRTAQLASLSQIFLSPFSRTIHGFMVLIEKDWQSAGFQFATRNGLADSNYQKSEERAPIFLQFIDCVFQTLRQFPCSFEFNESLLLFVLDNVFGCQFGSFLCNNDRERRLCHLSSNTPSLWDEIEARRSEFSNPFYSDATDEVIVPSCAIEDVVLWNNYYLRFTRPAHPSRHDPREAAAVSLKQTNEALRAQVDALLQEIELLKASKASS